jgi:hypothetical protein
MAGSCHLPAPPALSKRDPRILRSFAVLRRLRMTKMLYPPPRPWSSSLVLVLVSHPSSLALALPPRP